MKTFNEFINNKIYYDKEIDYDHDREYNFDIEKREHNFVDYENYGLV